MGFPVAESIQLGWRPHWPQQPKTLTHNVLWWKARYVDERPISEVIGIPDSWRWSSFEATALWGGQAACSYLWERARGAKDVAAFMA